VYTHMRLENTCPRPTKTRRGSSAGGARLLEGLARGAYHCTAACRRRALCIVVSPPRPGSTKRVCLLKSSSPALCALEAALTRRRVGGGVVPGSHDRAPLRGATRDGTRCVSAVASCSCASRGGRRASKGDSRLKYAPAVGRLSRPIQRVWGEPRSQRAAARAGTPCAALRSSGVGLDALRHRPAEPRKGACRGGSGWERRGCGAQLEVTSAVRSLKTHSLTTRSRAQGSLAFKNKLAW
jgi:hypothetical protein